MSTFFITSSDSTCMCGEGSSPDGFIKDTVCGRNAFTNLMYLTTGSFCLAGLIFLIFFHIKVLSSSTFQYKNRLKLMMFFSYLYFIGQILKAMDPLLHYQHLTYVLIEDSAIVIVFIQCIYLSIWGKVLQQTYNDGSPTFRKRAQKASVALDVTVGLICIFYLCPLFYTLAMGKDGYRYSNPYHTPSVVVFTLLPLTYLALGVWLLLRLKSIQDLIFSATSKVEVILNIFLGGLLSFGRGIYDWVDILVNLYPLEESNCRNVSATWGLLMGLVQFIEALPILILFIFLAVCHYNPDVQTNLKNITTATQQMQRQFLQKLNSPPAMLQDQNPIMLSPYCPFESESEDEGASYKDTRLTLPQGGSSKTTLPQQTSSFLRRWGSR